MDKITFQSSGKTSESSKRRLININFIEALPINDLIWSKREKLIHIYTTSANEEIFLQYPGKESLRDKKPNDRDFRPKIIINNKEGKDLSFGDVWKVLLDMLEAHSTTDKEFLKAVNYLIILLYKCAFLIDFDKTDNPEFETLVKEGGVINKRELEVFNMPVLLLSKEKHKDMFDFLQQTLGNLCGMSVEGFVLYNDILAWNEDVKYYRRGVSEGKNWRNSVGKPNTLLTHVSIFKYIKGDIKTSDLLSKFVRGRGVATPTKKELLEIIAKNINPEIEKI